jgi:hypothetical protein
MPQLGITNRLSRWLPAVLVVGGIGLLPSALLAACGDQTWVRDGSGRLLQLGRTPHGPPPTSVTLSSDGISASGPDSRSHTLPCNGPECHGRPATPSVPSSAYIDFFGRDFLPAAIVDPPPAVAGRMLRLASQPLVEILRPDEIFEPPK